MAEPRVLHRGDAPSEAGSRPRTRPTRRRCRSTALPIALRLGALKPDWRLPTREGRGGRLEGHAGARQLGVARPAGLRRRRLVHAHGRRAGSAAAESQRCRSGAIRNTGEVWVNGQRRVTAAAPPRRRRRPAGGRGAGRGAAPARRGRGFIRRATSFPPARSSRARTRSRCASRTRATTAASSARRRQMFVQVGRDTRSPIAGPWKYRVERQTNAGALYTKPGELAAHVAFTAAAACARRGGARRMKPVAPRRRTSRCG